MEWIAALIAPLLMLSLLGAIIYIGWLHGRDVKPKSKR
jgi:hypothetical protein